MSPFQNQFTKSHLFLFLGIWLAFTALTYWIADHGIDDGYDHRRLVILPYGGAFLIGGTLSLFIKLPFQWGASALRMTLWVVGLLGWFLGGIVSFGHALG